MRKARSYAHIAAAKKWNNMFRLSASLSKRERNEKHFRRVRAGQLRINEKGVAFMFARGVEVIAKPSKTLEVAETIRERALPILRKTIWFCGSDRSGVGHRG